MKSLLQFFGSVLLIGFSTLVAQADPIVITPRCPYLINQPGVYTLNSDMKCTTYDKSAIVIENTHDVQLKLNGHTITGTLNSAYAGPAAIKITKSQNILIDAAGAKVTQFTQGMEIDTVANFSLRNPTNSPFIIDTKDGLRALTLTGALISSVQVLKPQSYGMMFYATDKLTLSNIRVNQGVGAGIAGTGLHLSNVSNSTVDNYIVNKATKGFEIQQSKSIRLSNLQYLNGGYEGISLTDTQNMTFTNTTINSYNYGILLFGNALGVSFNGLSITAGAPNRLVCWVSVQPTALPTFLNSNPVISNIEKCIF